MQLEKAIENNKLHPDDMEEAKNLRDWRIVAFNWNEPQTELVKKILERAKVLKHYSLYAITDGEAVKLGVASNVKKRLLNLQTANHKKLGIIWERETGIDKDFSAQLERDLHIKCREFKLNGEWFSLECMPLVVAFEV